MLANEALRGPGGPSRRRAEAPHGGPVYPDIRAACARPLSGAGVAVGRSRPRGGSFLVPGPPAEERRGPGHTPVRVWVASPAPSSQPAGEDSGPTRAPSVSHVCPMSALCVPYVFATMLAT